MKIEPILQSHCFPCHSHAADVMEGGLTLDSRSGWVEGGDRGAAIVPGEPDKSLVIAAIRREDPDLQMPPDDPLSDEQVQLLVEWVERGAPDPRIAVATVDKDDPTDWWSLRPLTAPAVPRTEAGDDVDRNPIDAFIERKQASANLTAAPPADRRTLMRRLYFDLHGLPPTPEAVDAFVADPNPKAYEKLVDQLLASPRYGERWARHWLDTVHFADSHGCEHDVFRPNAWRYRDYVIASLNRDTPWDRFIREQLAGDFFYPDATHTTPALGFIAAGPLELSRASTAPVTFDYLDRDDIVAQTMAAFASATANCARCHDHKFDPITQEDYYALQAVFAGGGKGDVTFDADADVAANRRRWTALLEASNGDDRLLLLDPQYSELVAEWEHSFTGERVEWAALSPAVFLTSGDSILKRLEDDSLLATGERPDKVMYTVTIGSRPETIAAIRLDVLADESLPVNGPGRADNGNFHLSEIEAFLFDAGANEPTPLQFKVAAADFNQTGWTIAHALDGDEETAWGIHDKVGRSHYAVFELAEQVTLRGSSQLVIRLKQSHGAGHVIGRFKLQATGARNAAASVAPDDVRAAIQTPNGERSESQRIAIAAHALRLKAEKELAKLPEQASVYAWSTHYSHGKEIETVAPPKTVHVLRRGDIGSPGAVATPGALSAIAALPGRFALDDPDNEAARRAALADWLAARDNPLTWRSVVNRIWARHFGRGLCDTPDEFGRMGGAPSHPELLDWLACWFRDEANGSIKELHRLILTSQAWRRQARFVDEAARSVDADNRMLWRMNARPLDAESFRDAVLQISGRLELAMGGPGIQQFTQLKGQQLTPKLDYDAFDWADPSAARRSIYRVVWRGIGDPFMESLDFPDLGLLAPKRGFSISALQALAVYNNDFVLHHARVLAAKLEETEPTRDAQVNRACRLILLREPDEAERALLIAYADAHGLAALCRVLFNCNEFIFLD